MNPGRRAHFARRVSRTRRAEYKRDGAAAAQLRRSSSTAVAALQPST